MEQLNARVRETGIAHDLFSDPASATQPWRIDLVPLIVGARGVARAGARPDPARAPVRGDPRRPLRAAAAAGLGRHPAPARVQRSLLPAPLPRSPAAQAASSSSSPPTWPAGPDGGWRVIDTHAETPAGIGYALANRMVHTNVAGDMFSACKALRLAPFFQQLQGALAAPRRPRRPHHRPADAGAAPQRLLQPRLPRPLSRPDAGGRRRPARHRRPRLAQDAARPDADRPDRALRGRRRRRPAGARLLGLRRARRAPAGRAPASRLRRQRAGLRARREPRPERLPSPARQEAAGRGAR